MFPTGLGRLVVIPYGYIIASGQCADMNYISQVKGIDLLQHMGDLGRVCVPGRFSLSAVSTCFPGNSHDGNMLWRKLSKRKTCSRGV